MKRFYTIFKSLVVAVAMASTMLIASCSNEEEPPVTGNKFNPELYTITERLAFLEEQLGNEVEALALLVNNKCVVVDVTQEQEGTIVTLSDGSSFAISAKEGENFTSSDVFLSVAEENGSLYLAAYAKGAFKEWLLVGGERIAIYDKAAERVCEFDLMVDYDTEMLMISVDGGNTYADLGIDMVGSQESKISVGAGIFLGATLDEINRSVALTTTYGTLNTTVAEVIKFNVESTLYVKAGQSKSATFDAGEGVSNIYIMDEPLGWSAIVEGNTLTVTAPSKEVYDMGAAQKSGTITLHLNNAAGTCKVAKLDVAYAEIYLTIDKQGNFEVRNAVVETFERMNPYGQMVDVTDFIGWEILVMPLAEYTGDLVSDLQTSQHCAMANSESLVNFNGIEYTILPYQEGVTESLVCKGTVKALVEALSRGALSYDEGAFVVAVAPMDMATSNIKYEEATVVPFVRMSSEVEVASTDWNSVSLNVRLLGYEQYFLNVETMYEINLSATYYADQLDMFANMGYFGAHSIKGNYVATNVSLNDFMNYEAEYNQDFTLIPGTEYELAILPIEKDKKDYTIEDLVRIKFTTEDIVEATTPADITMTAVTEFTTIKPTVTIPENTVALYYGWSDAFVADDTEKNATVRQLLSSFYKVTDFTEGYTISSGEAYTLYNWNLTDGLTSGQTKVMSVVVVDNQGKYTFKQEAFTTKIMTTNTTYTLGVGDVAFANGALNVPVTGLDGADIAKYRYYLVDVTYWSLKDNETIKSEIASSNHIHYMEISGDAITNPLVITQGLSGYDYKQVAAGTTYKFALVAIFADGSVSNAVVIDEITYEMELVKATAPDYEAMKPTLKINSITYEPEWGSWYVDFSFDLPEGVTTVYAAIFDPEYITNQAGRSAKVSYVVDNCVYTETPGIYTEQYVGFSHYNIYFTWVDTAGRYYEVASYQLKEILEANIQ